MTRTIRHLLVAVLVGAAVLAGCTAPSLDAVPTVAPTPFICDGVPLRSAELILGGQVDAAQHGSWKGDPLRPFQCRITLAGQDFRDGLISILPNPIGVIGEDTDEVLIQYMGGPEHAQPMTADAPGRGFTSRLETEAGAVWVCDGFATSVQLINVDVEGRDAQEDSANLLRSMLPWACESADVPSATN